MASNREKIGSFFVDTGVVLVGDPCQFIHDPAHARPHLTYSHLGELFYAQGTRHVEPAVVVQGQEVVPVSERVERAMNVTVPSRSGGVGGIAITTGCDGWYPVFIERDKDGNLLRIVIECGGQVEP